MKRGLYDVFSHDHDGGRVRAYREGRILVHDGRPPEVLEDYSRLLRSLLNGTDDAHRLRSLENGPYLRAVRWEPGTQDGQHPEHPLDQPYQAERPTPGLPAPVFHFQRAGMDRPHLLEARGDQLTIDGNPLSPAESAAVLGDLETGAGQTRYARRTSSQPLQPEPVQKAEAPEPPMPSLDKDPVVPALGNLRALRQRTPRKGEVRVTVGPPADFHVAHHEHGRGAAEDAARAIGEAVAKTASEHDGEAYRLGHVEHAAYFPNEEKALLFARAYGDAEAQLVPVGGSYQVRCPVSVQSPEPVASAAGSPDREEGHAQA